MFSFLAVYLSLICYPVMVMKSPSYDTRTPFSHNYLQIYHLHWLVAVKHLIHVFIYKMYIHRVNSVVVEKGLNCLHPDKLTVTEMTSAWCPPDSTA